MKAMLLIFSIIIFCFCSRKSTHEKDISDSVLRIDLLSEAEAKVTKLSEFAENIDYIPLQTTESSLIDRSILKIVNIDKKTYVKNSGFGGEIMCFDMNGKFLYKISNTGRGPEEYSFITDFDISSDDKNLIILSGSNHKLLIYNISDVGFTFRESITLKEPIPSSVSMVPETDNAFLAIPPWRGTEPTQSLIINSVGDTVHIKPNCYKYEKLSEKGLAGRGKQTIIYSTENMVCFKENFSDTVFYVDIQDNSFKPRMIFDSHGTFITPDMVYGPETPGNNTNWIANIFETSRYVFYWYGTFETRPRILFDKKTNTKYKLGTDEGYRSKLKDDLSGGPDFNIEFIDNFYSGGKLFSFADAITLKRYVESEAFTKAKLKYPKKKEDLKKLADSLEETDNPVLIVVTPKE